MKKLMLIAGRYTGLILKSGVRVEYDDVLGELALTHCKGLKAYAVGGDHVATMATYLDRCYHRRMQCYASEVAIRQAFEVASDADIEVAIEDGTYITTEVQEITRSLSVTERMVLKAMLGPALPSESGDRELSGHNGLLAVAATKATGLSARRVERMMQKITGLMLAVID